jgi:hypothetical protein
MSRGLKAGLVVLLILIVGIASLWFFTGFNFANITKNPLPIPIVSIAGNWAGYEVINNFANPKSTVQGISGSWTVPSVKNLGSDTYSSVWVGIGGQFDQTLIQVGTEQDSTNGSANYYAWYELLPSNSVPIATFQVSPGDQMAASISLIQANSSLWTITIDDLSNHGHFQNDFNYNSQKLTAEWIVERPEVNGILTQLADFGSVTFTQCTAILSGTSGAISHFSYNDIYMQPELVNNKSIQLVTVSMLENGGTQFTVSYIGG